MGDRAELRRYENGLEGPIERDEGDGEHHDVTEDVEQSLHPASDVLENDVDPDVSAFAHGGGRSGSAHQVSAAFNPPVVWRGLPRPGLLVATLEWRQAGPARCAPARISSRVVNVVATLRARGLFEPLERLHGAGKIDLELVPFGALVAAGFLPFGELVVAQRVELDAGLA